MTPSVKDIPLAPGDQAQRVLFVLTSMPVGGAETLLADLVEGMPRRRFEAEIVCLKQPGVLGERLAAQFPIHHGLIRHRFDVLVLYRLWRLFRERKAVAVITVGCGDKMFWGRIAAWLAGVPVIASALHSTGWPDGVGRLNRCLTPLTDAFIAVAPSHGKFLEENEKFPRSKVVVIPNGIDTARFKPQASAGRLVREELDLPRDAKLCTIVAAIRPEKNHARFLRIARAIANQDAGTHFLVIGDGPLRPELEQQSRRLALDGKVHFLGNRADTDRCLAASDLFMLTSDNEAYPVSILEAMACGLPVVASDVGSIHELVESGVTGFRVPAADETQFADCAVRLLKNAHQRAEFGTAARRWAEQNGSRDGMIQDYVTLITRLLSSKSHLRRDWTLSLLTLGFRNWAR
jgi:glycosyltransferase involved in cell wall biosynthesis